MNLSFLPGELHLSKTTSGDYVIKIQDEEVFTTRNEKKAIIKFNTLRKEMESKFPPHEITPEEESSWKEIANPVCTCIGTVNKPNLLHARLLDGLTPEDRLCLRGRPRHPRRDR